MMFASPERTLGRCEPTDDLKVVWMGFPVALHNNYVAYGPSPLCKRASVRELETSPTVTPFIVCNADYQACQRISV